MQPLSTNDTVHAAAPKVLDAVIVGAGFAGLYMLHRLRGLGLSARIFEAGHGVGGTWFWNRYPGARCDVESVEYSYSFSEELEREWQWSERYAGQPEILRYLNYVADRFDLRRNIQFDTRVTSAVFEEASAVWTVCTDRGSPVSARFCVMATGCLSVPKATEYNGIDDFRGKCYSTATWPDHIVDFTGQTVGVIGTGSSGIQLIPIIAGEAAHLYVFQRTPAFAVPARNDRLAPSAIDDRKMNGTAYREQARNSVFGILSVDITDRSAIDTPPVELTRAYEERWARGGFSFLGAFGDLLVNKQANETAAEFVRAKIHETVRDPGVAEKLTPKEYPIGAKRMCLDTNYYATFNRENVTLVDVAETPIETITPSGIRTSDREYALDRIVFATGFDAMTGALSRIDIRGRNGLSLKEKWAAGPRAYLGLMISGFPNLFTITGPGSPSVLSNMVLSIEQHVDWIADCIGYIGSRTAGTIEAMLDAETEWVDHVEEVASQTIFPLANSWYVGANVPGKPRMFMPYIGGVGAYRDKCRQVAVDGYEGFIISVGDFAG
ncbi:MAG: NAD(P)/FAD-dependent oxidoreductase [Bryobacteraceae bacterium]